MIFISSHPQSLIYYQLLETPHKTFHILSNRYKFNIPNSPNYPFGIYLKGDIIIQYMLNQSCLGLGINFILLIFLLSLLNIVGQLMDSPLNYSRFSKNDSQIFRSTGNSIVFKTVGRDTKPAWSNRFVKDVNDLDYALDINLLGKQKSRSRSVSAKWSKNPSVNKNPKLNVHSKRNSFFSQELEQIQKINKLFTSKFPPTESLSQHKRKTSKHLSTVDTYGLSSFEFKNTITGKMYTRGSIHLKFDKKPERKMDDTIIWYNTDMEINLTEMDEKKHRKDLERFHPFESYPQRRVFQTKDKLDRVYEIDQGKRKTSPNRISETVAIGKVQGRRDEKLKPSAGLSYDIRGCQQVIKRSPPKYTITNSAKQLVFTKQIIDPKRGCCR